MDERWLWCTVLVACCSASISATLDQNDYADLLDDDYWSKNLDDYGDEPIDRSEESIDDEKIYVRPEDGKDTIVADDNKGQVNDEVEEDDLFSTNEEPTSDDQFNDNDEPLDLEKDGDEFSEKIVEEEIHKALAEDTATSNENKLDVDYQVEDNRSQVQNKFDEVNEDEINGDMNSQNEEDIENIPRDLSENVIGDKQEISDDNNNTEEDVIDEVERDTNHNSDEREQNVKEHSEEILESRTTQLEFSEVPEKMLNQNGNTEHETSFDDKIQEPIYEDKEKFGHSEVSSELDTAEQSIIKDIVQSDEDTVDKVYGDLKEDLNELFNTMNKLIDNDSGARSIEKIFEDKNSDNANDHGVGFEELKSSEEIQEIPESADDSVEFVDSGEKLTLKLRQDYFDSMKDYNFVDYENDETGDSRLSNENIDQHYETVDENEKEAPLAESQEFEKSDEREEYVSENIDDDTIIDKESKTILEEVPLASINEEEQHNLQNVVTNIENTDTEYQKVDDTDHTINMAGQSDQSYSNEKTDQNLSDLTSAEVNDLMTQFAIDHSDELDVNSANFDQGVAPIYITLKVGEAVVIESPNYPNVYPSNNIIDWIIDGEGTGIEMNVTDVALNGLLGDYLLVKPGGIDDSGTEGLIFSYKLRSERRYRFLDVNRIFIRFQSHQGMSLLDNRGFRVSLKLLMPLSEDQAPIPEPEAIVQTPQQTMQVYLAGVSPHQFVNQSEAFRLIVADMATLYINRMELELEDFNAKDVTQLTQTATCNVNWPGFERCVGVSFGVPLPADEEDEEPGLTTEQLYDMWSSFVDVDPFAARLRRLGITEFAIPNDRSTLLVWLVIGAGVVISAGMLALALWRWSCFEDYTRMPAFSDTDSVISEKKRHLDLYPTPHQTLPPLYDDDFVKYDDSARDMGGFANKSFAREGELLDLESDDDLGVMQVQRDRSSNIQPKDIYQV